MSIDISYDCNVCHKCISDEVYEGKEEDSIICATCWYKAKTELWEAKKDIESYKEDIAALQDELREKDEKIRELELEIEGRKRGATHG